MGGELLDMILYFVQRMQASTIVEYLEIKENQSIQMIITLFHVYKLWSNLMFFLLTTNHDIRDEFFDG